MDSAVNASLFSCLRDKEPVLVVKQLRDKTGPNGARYRLLGLGLIEGYDVTARLFRIRGLKFEEIQAYLAKENQGTDDPRNGLSMSRSVHWAFDKGIFTISDQYEILIHPKAKEAKIENFPLFCLDRKSIRLPDEEYYHPHQEALQWHRDEVCGKFAG